MGEETETKDKKDGDGEPSLAEQIKAAVKSSLEGIFEPVNENDDDDKGKNKGGNGDNRGIIDAVTGGIKEAFDSFFVADDDDDKDDKGDKGKGKKTKEDDEDDDERERSHGRLSPSAHKRLHEDEAHQQEHEKIRSHDQGPKRSVGPMARALGWDK